VTVTSERLTLDEFLARDFPPRTQLVNGEVVVNPPRKRHDRIAFHLARRLAEWVETVGSGEAGVALGWTADDQSYFVPDAWWIRDLTRVADNAVFTAGYPRHRDRGSLTVYVAIRHGSEAQRVRASWRRGALVRRPRFRDGDRQPPVEARCSRVRRHARARRGEALVSPLLRRFSITVDELFDR
jgi:hypothetical protein